MQYIKSDVNSKYDEHIEQIINNRKQEIFDFFGSQEIELPFDIYIYHSILELGAGLKARGFKQDPDYMCACHKDSDNSLNFFEPKDNPAGDEWSKEEYDSVIFHELIHGVQYTLFGEQPEWLCEGIAKYLDGTYEKGIQWLFENYIHRTLIPSQQELEDEFGFHDYDSYDYAYVMVSYLIENLGKDVFIKVLKDKDLLATVSDNLLIKSICYYNNKYFGDKYYNSDLNNPQWLFHGTPKKLDRIVPMMSHDSDNNQVNIDNAVFVTSSKLIASAYAFKDTIKEGSKDLKWNFQVSQHEEVPIMTMENVSIRDDMEGYIYVFLNDGNFRNEPFGSLQFKSFSPLEPIDCIEASYVDYKDNYEVLPASSKRL